MNQLFYGDNITIMQRMGKDSIRSDLSGPAV